MSLFMLLSLIAITALQAQNEPVINPEKLPAPLDKPLKLLATTGMSGKGQDYFTLGPKQKAVVGTITGPAIIFRVWSTSSASAMVSLDVTVDGKKRTLYEKGKPVGIAANDPLQAMDKQAFWSYVPMVVKSKATFTARSADPKNDIKFYLQAGYRSVPASDLKLISKPVVDQFRSTIAKFMQGIGSPQPTPVISSGPATLQAPFTPTITEPTLRMLQIVLPDEATIEQVQATRLTITCDGSRTIDVPLGALFGEYWQLADYNSAAMSVQGKTLIMRFPMPIAQSVSVAISRYGKGTPLNSITVTLPGWKLPTAPTYHFCAQYFSQISVKDQPLQLLNVTGPGIFVGSNLATDGIARKTFAFLEGNEQIYVDGATTPTVEGTGTEDYFNNSWYFETGALTRAFHGVPFIQPKDPPRVVAYRWMIPDCMPFKSSFRYDLQHGSRNGAPDVLYSGVMFWYQQGQVNVAEPVEAKLPQVEAGTTGGGDSAKGLVTPSILGGIVIFIFAVIAALIFLSRRKAMCKRM
jgi:hypothetical protein